VAPSSAPSSSPHLVGGRPALERPDGRGPRALAPLDPSRSPGGHMKTITPFGDHGLVVAYVQDGHFLVENR
jgi:hypothetical protein